MSQFDFGTIDPNVKTGTQLAADLNQWRAALHSSHSGVAQPAYAAHGMLWVDNSTAVWQLKMVSPAGSVSIAGIDSTTGVNVIQNATITGIFKALGSQAASASANIHEINSSTVSAEYALRLRNGGTSVNGLSVLLPNVGGTATEVFISGNHIAGPAFSIRANSGLVNTQANNVNVSDASVKQDIVPAPDYTAFVEKVQFKRFSYADHPDAGEVDGVIAQEIAELDPSLVTTAFEGKLGIYDHRLQQRINSVVPKLIERIKALEEKLAVLENK